MRAEHLDSNSSVIHHEKTYKRTVEKIREYYKKESGVSDVRMMLECVING